jgi:hypothetical protein
MMEDERPKCKFLTCFAGTGVAGNGHCSLGGDPQNPDCPKYQNEDEKLKEWGKGGRE